MLEQGEYYDEATYASDDERYDGDANIDPALQDLPFAQDPFFVNTTPETMSTLTQKFQSSAKAKGKAKSKAKPQVVKDEYGYDNDGESPSPKPVSPDDEFRPDDYLYVFTPYDPSLPHQALVDLSLQNDGDGQPEHIKRVTNKFMVFRKHFGRNYKHVYDPVTGLPTKPIPQKFISKMAGHIWSTMDGRARQPYENAYNDLKEAFVRAHPDYKYSPMKKEAKAAKRAEDRERRRREAEGRKVEAERAREEDRRARKAAGMTIKDWNASKAAVRAAMGEDVTPRRRPKGTAKARAKAAAEEEGVKDEEEEDDLAFEHAALPKHLEGHVIQAMQILEKNSTMDAAEAMAQALNPPTPEEEKFVRPIAMPALPMAPPQFPIAPVQSIYQAYHDQFHTPHAQHTFAPPPYPPPMNNFRETRPLPQRAQTTPGPSYMSAQLALANQMAMAGQVPAVSYQHTDTLGSPFLMAPLCEGAPYPTANPKRRRPELSPTPDPIRASITKPSLYDAPRAPVPSAPSKDFFWSGRAVVHPTKGWVRADSVNDHAAQKDGFSIEALISPMRKASIALPPMGMGMEGIEGVDAGAMSTDERALEAMRRASIDIVMDERRSLSVTWSRKPSEEDAVLRVTPLQQLPIPEGDLSQRRPSQFRVSFSLRQPNPSSSSSSSKRRISYSAQGGRSRQPSWAEPSFTSDPSSQSSDLSQPQPEQEDFSQIDVLQFDWPLPEGSDEWTRFNEIGSQLATFIPAGLGSSLATLSESAEEGALGGEAYAWLNETLEAYRSMSYGMQDPSAAFPGQPVNDFLGHPLPLSPVQGEDPEYDNTLEDFTDFERYTSSVPVGSQ